MQAGLSSAREVRAQYRHELRTLTYIAIDQANGGIVHNLSSRGIGIQAVAAVRPGQQVSVRFDLRYPRLRVETRGEVIWSTVSGQCGIRLLDLPPRLVHQINEWIFGNLLDGSVHAEPSMFGASPVGLAVEDGLMVSPAPLKIIELPPRHPTHDNELPDSRTLELDWLSQPLSGRSLAWILNSLVVIAAVSLFALVFLSITREPPPWPIALACAAIVAVGALYWGFFRIFGSATLGTRLARLRDASSEMQEEEKGPRFR